jgi:hypothetical protein
MLFQYSYGCGKIQHQLVLSSCNCLQYFIGVVVNVDILPHLLDQSILANQKGYDIVARTEFSMIEFTAKKVQPSAC